MEVKKPRMYRIEVSIPNFRAKKETKKEIGL